MIDFVVASIGILESIDGCQITNYHNIIITDHRGFLVDLQLDDYFQVYENFINKLDYSKLNFRKLSHKTKFSDKIDDMIKITKLEELVDMYCNSYATDKMLKMIDNKISFVLKKARKHVEGP